MESTSRDVLDIVHVARDTSGSIVGAACLGRTGSRGILRSVVVAPNHRRKGLGSRLVAHCETSALIAGITEVYLRTATLPAFFVRNGYQELSRKVVPAAITAHPQFQSADPDGTKYLGKRL